MILLIDRPCGSFFENEVSALLTSNQKVLVLYESKCTEQAIQSEDMDYIQLKPNSNRILVSDLLKYIIPLTKHFIDTPLKDILFALRAKSFRTMVLTQLNALRRIQEHFEEIRDHPFNDGWLHSFWFYDLSFAISLKKNHSIRILTSRCHRGDLFDGIHAPRVLLLRRYSLKYIDQLFPISKHGCDFLHQKYPEYKQKVRTVYLGSIKTFESDKISKPSDALVIVSCSRLTNMKRVEAIPLLLSKLHVKFHWHHFGSGPQEFVSQLSENIEKAGIGDFCTLHGYTPNIEVQRFFSDTFIDTFISLSEIEGVPVSFMEALCYGIPVLATDVGGNHEIISTKTGTLIPVDFETAAFEDILLIHCRQFREKKDRQKIKQIWSERFNLYKNFQSIIKYTGR